MRFLLTALPLVFLAQLTANEVAGPPITRETLVGVWEAAPTAHHVVYRLEINKTDPSYLAFTLGGKKLVYRLVSCEVRDGNVKLHFRCLTDRRQSPVFRVSGGPEMNELWISGKGDANEKGGVFNGILRLKESPYDDGFTSSPITFAKPPWTRDLVKVSKGSEALIKAIKSHN